MLRGVRIPSLPNPQTQDFYPQPTYGTPGARGISPGRGFGWAQSMYQALTDWCKQVTDVINTGNQVQNVVPSVASATTIAITAFITHVTGTVAIENITVESDFGGQIVLIADDAWTLITGGNIARAAAPGIAQALTLTYDHTLQMWFPSI